MVDRALAIGVSASFLALAAVGCAPRDRDATAHGEAKGTGTQTAVAATGVRVDGSSTVYPITEAVAEEYRKTKPDVRVTVGISGTGGGFKKFAAGEIDIADASRPIKAEEAQALATASIEYIELPIAYDGLSVVVNPSNKFVDHLSVEELHAIWGPESQVKMWSDVRPAWPKEPLALYGPGHDSGTFDYFTEVINGKAQACRADFTASEDDNVLVQGVAGDKGSLGFFGYAYYVENKDRIRAVPIVTAAGPVAPSPETIRGGTYTPLSRPVFIYVNAAAAERPEVQEFVNFYIDQVTVLVPEVGYVALPDNVVAAVKARFQNRVKSSVYGVEGAKGKTLEQLYVTTS